MTRVAGSIQNEKPKSCSHFPLLAAGNVDLETQQSASSPEADEEVVCAMLTRDGCASTASKTD